MQRREFVKAMGATAAGVFLGARNASPATRREQRPNILVCMADDWGWPFAPPYGDTAIRTPAFDRIAREGVLFTRAFCSAPTCTASRASMLTGQAFYRLKAGANLNSSLDIAYAVYPDLLEQAGYAVGFDGKGWGPGNENADGRKRNPAGPKAKGLAAFIAGLPAEQPFCYWMGSHFPHRPFNTAPDAAKSVDPASLRVPPFLPDCPEVRGDLSDYYAAVQRFDGAVARCLSALEKSGRLANTMIVVTGDNGMPFPRCKANLYDYGVHQPLAVCWPGRVAAGRTVDDFVSLTDFAPTFLEAAALAVPSDMTGRSLLPILLSEKSGSIEAARDFVVVGREKHVAHFPMRSIRTARFSYIRNYASDFPEPDCDNGPSKAYLTEHREDARVGRCYEQALGSRPPEEFYDLGKDPWEMDNLAGRADCADAMQALARRLDDHLARTGDPRVLGQADVFEGAGRRSASRMALP